MRKTIYLPVFVIIKDYNFYLKVIENSKLDNYSEAMDYIFCALDYTSTKQILDNKHQVVKLYNYMACKYMSKDSPSAEDVFDALFSYTD